MLSGKRFTYYQPQAYYDDGTCINYGSLPEELFSFQAFRTREDCEEWLKNHNYNPGDFAIIEYHDEDIEEVTLIDQNGDIIPKIEDFEIDEIEDMLTDEVLFAAGSIDNLKEERQDGETKDQYMDRLYGLALDKVNDAVVAIEESGDYDFSSYGGNPEVEWYDEARDEAVNTVIRWMIGTEE
jgi:hypothetical protein